MKFLGIDLGSSSVKVGVYNADTGKSEARAFFPKQELAIEAPQTGWAEQNPETWWSSFKGALKEVGQQVNLKEIAGIGISYQMHGLVAVDANQNVVRPAIIWCDSRAVEIGDRALDAIGLEKCLTCMLNSPGNFTASKLGWVKVHEPETFSRIEKIMLPGDYMAMRLSGNVSTTTSGLSEGILWDFQSRTLARDVMDYFGFTGHLIPELVPTMGKQALVSNKVAHELGLTADIPITYRAGDQPNNALSLNVLQPGDVATTAGTSAVIYAVTDTNAFDQASRVNGFLHVNDAPDAPRNGILLCVNGSGILYSWLKRLLSINGKEMDYLALNEAASKAPIGSDGLHFMPFGNGAERILSNKNLHAQMINLDFNTHSASHVIRAAKEGIVNAMNYGLDVIREMNVPVRRMRAGASNLFLSPLFREAFVNTTGVPLELYETDGAEGAARGAAVGHGYQNLEEAFANLQIIETVEPSEPLQHAYGNAFAHWKDSLDQLLHV